MGGGRLRGRLLILGCHLLSGTHPHQAIDHNTVVRRHPLLDHAQIVDDFAQRDEMLPGDAILIDDSFRERWPAGLDPKGDRSKNSALFTWSDLNGDGRVQPGEVTIIKASTGGVTVM